MKDSRVPWIGSIPVFWEMRKISRSFSVIGSGTTPSTSNSSFHEEGSIPWVNTGDLNDNFVIEPKKKLTEYAFKEHSTLRLYPIGTLLIAMYGATIGKVGILGVGACTNQACCALAEPKNFEMRFVYYWFLDNRKNLVTLSFGSSQPNINQDLIRQLRIQAPPIPIQRCITAYLDEQTAKIDRLINMRRRQMELLKEQWAALIQQAVTRGLDPDAPMKDSGIPWLGEIPVHWKKTKLLRIAPRGRGMFVNGPFGSDLLTSELTDSGVPVVYIRDIQANGYLRVSEVCVTPEKAASLDVCRVDAGDIVVAKVGTPPGTAAIYPDTEPSGIVTQDVIRIKTDPRKVVAEFIVYWLNSDAGRASIDQISVESTRMRVDLESYKSLRIWLPPVEEQRKIKEFIQNETAKTNDLIASYARQLTLLAEYRAALIHECVTGQRTVDETSLS
ncbi:type I restriction enzyme S subunit [Nitrosomonas oligotropha]|uniref:Type I restriction enzyme S subunit n=1 Tax=Nitrosomonas oligotropha TaxID=42354 RepID=A0A2T5HZ27_9PROT|nr:restriction endonuclease subunit S [Nitrosomonas oligotropha]PTQ76834.1 type I restriction enzyme S subunit [Nitrosomonas oligotropha]